METDKSKWNQDEVLVSEWPAMKMVACKKAEQLQSNETELYEKINTVCKRHVTDIP